MNGIWSQVLTQMPQLHFQRPLWLWAQASSDVGRWHLLRCALYSSGKSAVRAAPIAAAEPRA